MNSHQDFESAVTIALQAVVEARREGRERGRIGAIDSTSIEDDDGGQEGELFAGLTAENADEVHAGMAAELLAKVEGQMASYSHVPDDARKRRLLAWVQRKGFSWGLASTLTEMALGSDGEEMM